MATRFQTSCIPSSLERTLHMKLFTFLELFGRVILGDVCKQHPPQQGIGARDLFLTDPVVHDAEVWVVGCKKAQQCGMQTFRGVEEVNIWDLSSDIFHLNVFVPIIATTDLNWINEFAC